MHCIEDFCGRHKGEPVQFWADWCPSCRSTHFGCMWNHVPPLLGDMPTEAEVEAHTAKYGGWQFVMKLLDTEGVTNKYGEEDEEERAYASA